MADQTPTDTPTSTTADSAGTDSAPVPSTQKAYQRYLAKKLTHDWAWGRYGELTDAAEKSSDHRDADRFHDESLVPATQEALDAAVALIDALTALAPEIQTALDEAYAYRQGDDYDDERSEDEQARLDAIRALADQLGMKV